AIRRHSVRQLRGLRWVNSRSVKACPGLRIRGCCGAAAATSATSCCRAWCSAMCCAPRTRTRASARSTRARPRRRRGCSRCSPARTGRPRDGATCRCPADGSAFRPPYPALVKDRVRFTGDYVAFVVAETLIQAQDAAELIAVDYEPLPAVVSTAEATAAGAPRVWDQSPDNIGFVQLFGDKAATDVAFANAAHVVKHRFVINRVTAASMEPRGSLGDYNATEDRSPIYTTLQRAHPFRAELTPILKVPESKIRVIAGDIGGSFGMKSAVYNEVALVLLASKRVGRPVKWTSTRSESF